MGMLKKLKEANDAQREQIKEHGHSGMFEAAGAGILGVGGFTPNLTDNSVVKIPWGIGQKRMVERKIQQRTAQGSKLVSQHKDGGNNVVLTFSKTAPVPPHADV
jgi:hypothetical protein